MPEIVLTQFQSRNSYGDFLWMLHQEKYKNSLFIFNDNEEDMNSYKKGGGNACIRPFNFLGHIKNGFSIPRSAGIPTGRQGRGYTSLKEGKTSIDFSLNRISKLIEKYHYDKVFISVDQYGMIGNKIFHMPSSVKEYITRGIFAIINE